MFLYIQQKVYKSLQIKTTVQSRSNFQLLQNPSSIFEPNGRLRGYRGSSAGLVGQEPTGHLFTRARVAAGGVVVDVAPVLAALATATVAQFSVTVAPCNLFV